MKTIGNKVLVALLILNVFYLQAQIDYNKLDEKGNKNGLWKGFYADTKNQKFEGTFDHGKEVGTFTFFDNTKSKKIVATREFNAKDNSVYTIFFDAAKNKVGEGKEINKVYEGEWKYYHKNSKAVMTIENYSKGKLEGLRTVFYANGKLAEETTYKNGQKNGAYKKYNESGIVLEESIYKKNEFDGPAIFREPEQGNIVSKGKFTNGKKTGIWQFYNKGKLDKELNMSYPQNKSKNK